MSTLIPTASSCHTLRLPPTEKDDRLNLNVRTGSASTLYKSLVFTYGGLTIGLDIQGDTIDEVILVFHLKILNMKSRLISKYLSGEFFYLDLIEKNWKRVDIPRDEMRPKPRMYHEVTAVNNCIYVFGGLIVNKNFDETDDTNEKELIPCNDLWEFNLETGKWALLHDGLNYENDSTIPSPRSSHKMTTLSSLTFVNRGDHFGIFIAGGKDKDSNPLFDNFVFDLVSRDYVGLSPIDLVVDNTSSNQKYDNINSIVSSDDYKLNVDYRSTVIVSFIKDVNNLHRHEHSRHKLNNMAVLSDYTSTTEGDESLIVYTRVDPSKDTTVNPLLSFKLGKTIKKGKVLPLHRRILQKGATHSNKTNFTIPYNLSFPKGGLFGQNIVITGFLPNENDISVFVYNKPTGKWSRLNFFCDHDYGSHRFWGGFAWQSHHKVVLLGNCLPSNTASSTRYFNLMITVSLPITNILASLELEGGHYHCPDGTKVFFKDDTSSTDDNNRDKLSEEDAYSSSDALSENEKKLEMKRPSNASDKSHHPISFSEYVHYVAPKTKFTTIRSVFPPAAITLGRNAMDRYGDLISDFEFVSSNGDRIPVCMKLLMERWGRYFIQLLARGYVNAVDKFESDQKLEIESIPKTSTTHDNLSSGIIAQNKLKTSVSTAGGSSISSSNSEVSFNQNSSNKKTNFPSYHVSIPPPSKYDSKEPPQFRLPFQDSMTSKNIPEKDDELKNKMKNSHIEESNRVDIQPCSQESFNHDVEPGPERSSISSFSSHNSLLNSHLQNIPPQLPLPSEPLPSVPVPTSFRSSSRKNSADLSSPRASLMYTLTALRNIPPAKSPRDSPFASPRASVSGQGSGPTTGSMSAPLTNDLLSSIIPNLKHSSLNMNRNGPLVPRSLDSSPNASSDALPMNLLISENMNAQDARARKPQNNTASLQNVPVSKDKKPASFTSIHPMSNKLTSRSIDDQFEEDVHQDDPESLFNNPLLDFENVEGGNFRMEPSLIPRKLYLPFSTGSIKAFCEYLYTGQVGNKWLLTPVTLDNLIIGKYLDVPLLYDLISEVLFGIIGRKESFIIREGNKLKRRYNELLKLTNSANDSNIKFPLDEYEGFMDTIDDGFLDITLLKKTSAIHKNSSASAMSRRNKLSLNSALSFRYSVSIDDVNEHPMTMKEVPIEEDTKIKKKHTDGNQNELTDDSLDKTNSNSEEEAEYIPGYLDSHIQDTLSLNYGPRAKSIFDKASADYRFQSALEEEKEKFSEMEKTKSLNLTLEQLVSPKAPLPIDYTIDLIYETATICRDIKLMLRATNVKRMGEVFNKSKEELDMAIEELENKYEEQQSSTSNRNLSEVDTSKGKSSNFQSEDESESGLNQIRSNMSTSSLSTLGMRSVDLEKSKSNPGFRAIGSFGPFKSKTDIKPARTPFENNRELDKRITRLIKNDEKLKLKSAKDEKLKRLQDQKMEKKQTEKPKPPARKSLFSKYKDDASTSSLASVPTAKKKHGFLHHIGHYKKSKDISGTQNDDSLIESSKLSRTLSASGSISSTSSKKSQGLRIRNGLFGKKKSM